MIHTGDCVDVMAGMEPESVDAVVTDPPAGIGFMSKGWDHDRGGRAQWVAWMTTVMRECYRVLRPGHWLLCWAMPRTSHWTAWAIEDAGFRITDCIHHVFASGFPKGRAQLKPAYEPWWLARKPGPLRELGIDACRIEITDDDPEIRASNPAGRPRLYGGWPEGTRVPSPTLGGRHQATGRWPANVVLTDPIFDGGWDGVVGGGWQRSNAGTMATDSVVGGYGGLSPRKAGTVLNHQDLEGSYSRFFLIAKAPPSERILGDGRRSPHPTQKPEALIRHLVKLVTPPGGLVLDPFLGSGTLGVVCEDLGMRWIGIEREPQYAEWAQERLDDNRQRGFGLDVPAPTPEWKDYPTATRYPVKGPSQSSWFTDSTRDDKVAS